MPTPVAMWYGVDGASAINTLPHWVLMADCCRMVHLHHAVPSQHMNNLSCRDAACDSSAHRQYGMNCPVHWLRKVHASDA
jgi:hypothetical protein